MSGGSIAESRRDLLSVVCGEELTTSISIGLCSWVCVEVGVDADVEIVFTESFSVLVVIDFINSSW